MKYKEIIIWLIGGFGNNLFQLVLYYKLLDEGHLIRFNTQLTKKNIYTKYLRWKVHLDISHNIFPSNHHINLNFYETLFTIIKFRISKLFNKVVLNSFFYQENNNLNKSKHIIGYFQDKNFLKSNKIYINKVVEKLKSNFYDIKFKSQVVIHFRGKDSNNLESNKKYLKKILKKEKLNHITIITDDKKSIDNYLLSKNINVVSSSILNDFKYLCNASKKLYCSDSTFSWWAAHCVNIKCEVFMPEKLMYKHGFYSESKIHKI